ncbi:MAG: ribosomal-protein-alanine N-acetyltransferase [Chloroflexi bacterium]|nr:ribosomal-protein-alanine N-acetyltransferase [Chloroflexota bacterium]
MQVTDVPAVSAIEKLSFTTAWPASAYKREIERNDMGFYAVALRTEAAGPPRREGCFQTVEPEPLDSGMLARLTKRLRGVPPRFEIDTAEELERIVGYAGLWLMVDSGHITTIAVDPPYRGEGVGELLLLALVERAMQLDAVEVTLEVRVSNYVAQALYRKYMFRNSGLRKRYYSDDGEDALIMTTETLRSPVFRLMMMENRRLLTKKMEADG